MGSSSMLAGSFCETNVEHKKRRPTVVYLSQEGVVCALVRRCFWPPVDSMHRPNCNLLVVITMVAVNKGLCPSLLLVVVNDDLNGPLALSKSLKIGRKYPFSNARLRPPQIFGLKCKWPVRILYEFTHEISCLCALQEVCPFIYARFFFVRLRVN